jgi:transglutaminase-like putative cysteine protease
MSLVATPAATAESLTPRETLQRVDSLIRSGNGDAARTLCTGQALRLLPLLIEAEAMVTPFLDREQSSDTVLEEQRAGNWAALRVQSLVVFTEPFMGLARLETNQAVHLYQDDGVWKVADLEELASVTAPLVLKSGDPTAKAGSGSAGAHVNQRRDPSESLLPLSRLAPAPADHARVTRMQLRLSRRTGEAFAAVPLGASQRATPGVQSTTSDLFLETSRSSVPDTLRTGRAAPARDSLKVYLASTTELDLTDKMLRTRAAKLAQGSPSDVETARRVWTFVSTSFDYKLGATLFATSREALRDLKGDCSEAAVLTAALLRAAGIPSRVVLGYATLGQGVWIGHAWTEAWLGGARGGWVGVDAALREFPTGPHRVALVTLSGEEDMKAAATNLMLSTISNLDIDITGAWAGNKPVPLVTHPAAATQSRQFWKQVMGK